MSKKYYSILVKGKEPSVAFEGKLNKVNGTPDGPLTKLVLELGQMTIPNFSKVWAYRHKDKMGKPTGELTFLPWGKDLPGDKGKGELTKIRYVDSCSTLDYEYQKEVLKIVIDEVNRYEETQIIISNGVNDFDYETEAMLIEMIKHHTYNADNKSRDPKNREIVFSEYNPENLNKNNINRMKTRKLAEDIVLAAENDTEKLAVLADLFELDDKSQDAVIFNQLIGKLDNFEHFLVVIADAKNRFRFQLQQLVDKELIQFTDEGQAIFFNDGESDILINEIADMKNPVNSLTEDILNPKVYQMWSKIGETYKELMNTLQ